jgi:hypothetical protein
VPVVSREQRPDESLADSGSQWLGLCLTITIDTIISTKLKQLTYDTNDENI